MHYTEPPVRIDPAVLTALFYLPNIDFAHVYIRIIITPREFSEPDINDVVFQVHDNRETPVDSLDVAFEQHGVRFCTPKSTIHLLVDSAMEMCDGDFVLRHPLSDHYEVNQQIPERWEGLGARLLVVKSCMFGDGVLFTRSYEGRNYVVAFPYSTDGWEQAMRLVNSLVATYGKESRPKVSQLYQAIGAEFLLIQDLGGFVVIPDEDMPQIYRFGD